LIEQIGVEATEQILEHGKHLLWRRLSRTTAK